MCYTDTHISCIETFWTVYISHASGVKISTLPWQRTFNFCDEAVMFFLTKPPKETKINTLNDVPLIYIYLYMTYQLYVCRVLNLHDEYNISIQNILYFDDCVAYYYNLFKLLYISTFTVDSQSILLLHRKEVQGIITCQ